MKAYDNDTIDLGAVSSETHGSAQIGLDDVQPGNKTFIGGIETAD